jgi:hypothetical protein
MDLFLYVVLYMLHKVKQLVVSEIQMTFCYNLFYTQPLFYTRLFYAILD